MSGGRAPGPVRVVVAGLGDTGVLSAVELLRRRPALQVTGVSPTTGLVSGQELGLRLTRPQEWSRDYRTPYAAFRRLERAAVVHGRLVGLDAAARTVSVEEAEQAGGARRDLGYDVLVVATGVANGFWRSDAVRDDAEVARALRADHERLAAARSVLVVGGGAAAVGAAGNIAETWPGRPVRLAFPGERALPQHHGRTWAHVRGRLEAAGVRLLAEHRAVLPDPAGLERLGTGPVRFSTGQPPVDADVVLWAVGRVRPHTGWLPPALLDDDGFVRVDPQLRVPGCEGVFAIGDVAASDPLRSSARNFGHRLLAGNVLAHLDGRPLADLRVPGRRWGSVLGPQRDGMRVYGPTGRGARVPRWALDRVLQPWVVRRAIYGGVRRDGPADLSGGSGA